MTPWKMVSMFILHLSSYILMFREINLSFVVCDYLTEKLTSELRKKTHILTAYTKIFAISKWSSLMKVLPSFTLSSGIWVFGRWSYLFLSGKLMTLLLKIIRGSINLIIFQKISHHLLQVHSGNSNTTWH